MLPSPLCRLVQTRQEAGQEVGLAFVDLGQLFHSHFVSVVMLQQMTGLVGAQLTPLVHIDFDTRHEGNDSG